MSEYIRSKYKACSPVETVARIKEILKESKIETQETWIDSGISSICSVRINMKGTPIGQNGKGTDREFALASGYAEFLERLQTGYLLPECAKDPYDRKWMEPSGILQSGGSLLEGSFRQIIQSDGEEYVPEKLPDYLAEWSYDAQDGKLAVIPFRDLKEDKEYVIPESILKAYYFTNGSCAGNTREDYLFFWKRHYVEYVCTRCGVKAWFSEED